VKVVDASNVALEVVEFGADVLNLYDVGVSFETGQMGKSRNQRGLLQYTQRSVTHLAEEGRHVVSSIAICVSLLLRLLLHHGHASSHSAGLLVVGSSRVSRPGTRIIILLLLRVCTPLRRRVVLLRLLLGWPAGHNMHLGIIVSRLLELGGAGGMASEVERLSIA
jgi:hypothetical protein